MLPPPPPTPEELEFQKLHEEEEFAKLHAEDSDSSGVSPILNVAGGAFAAGVPMGLSGIKKGVTNAIASPIKSAMGVSTEPKPSGLMPPTQTRFADPKTVEERFRNIEGPRGQGTINWANNQYARGWTGVGTGQPLEAILHEQIDALEAKNPGFKVRPGTVDQLIPEHEHAAAMREHRANLFKQEQDFNNQAKMKAELRQKRLEEQARLQGKKPIGEHVINFGNSPGTKRFIAGYNAFDALQAQNPFEAAMSTVGAVSPYVGDLSQKVLPKRLQPLTNAAKIAGPLIGMAAPGINYLERKFKPESTNVLEGHAEGGAIQHFKDGKSALVEKVVGFLEHKPSKPNPLVGTRFELKDLGGIAPEKPTSLENMRDAMINITPWDATHRNQQILSVSGRPLTTEIISHGGTPYARDIEHMSQGIAGASGPAISNRLQKRSNIASQEGTNSGGSGRVIMLPSSMGKWSEDFAVPTFKTYYDFFKQAEHSPEELAKMTAWLRGQKKSDKLFMPNALDLSHPDSYNQLLTGEGLKGSSGDVRKAFIKLQRLKDNQRAMGVNAEDISAAHTIPEIANLERGFAGNTAIEMKPGAKTQPSKNESYGSDFLGNYLGNLGQNTPAHVLLNKPYTSAFNEMKARYPNDPEGKIHQMAIGALERRNEGVSELVNDEMINRVGAYHEAVNQGKINPNDPYGTLQYLKTPGAYAEGGEVQHFEAGRSVSQLPKVAQALEQYLRGGISNAERIKIMNEHLPIRKWNELPPNYTDEQIRNALMSNKQPKALADVPAGMQVGNRLDIPAYTQNGVYVDTVHDAAGKPISYNRTGHLTDVDFSSKPNQAVRVGLGTKEQALTPMSAEIGSGKSPFAMMKGTNVGTHDEEVRRMMQEHLNDPAWTQVGMDPRRHSQFYDKSTGMPVWSAEQKLQSGPLVMVPKQGLESTHWEDPRLSLSDFEGKHYDTGGLVALAKKFIPLAERETNKAKFLQNKHPSVPDMMYHGTAADINQFVPKQAGATFLTSSPRFAGGFSDASEHHMMQQLQNKLSSDEIAKLNDKAYKLSKKTGDSPTDLYQQMLKEQLPTGQNIMPVHVNATNPFDYENPEHIENLRQYLKSKNSTQQDSIPDSIKTFGDWKVTEMPITQQAIKNMGHDSFWVKEGGQKNLGIYDPNQIKSATGNVGTYDTTIPDITKAEGGLMHLKEGGSTEAWTRKEGKNPEGGLNAKGRASYNRAHDAHLKAPQPEGGSRKDSFCARMEGMKRKNTSSKTAKDPDSRINKSLRKWKC